MSDPSGTSDRPPNGTSDQPPAGPGASDNTVTDNACMAVARPASCGGAPIDVATASALEPHIRNLTEALLRSNNSSAGAALRPSPDLRVTSDVELDIQAFRTNGSQCERMNGPRPGCEETWAFSGEKTLGWQPVAPAQALPLIDGVACKDAGCARITIKAGTVLRFQRAQEINVFAGNYRHFVRVVRPCAAACSADELPCSTSSTCIDASAFCALCEGKALDACACQAGCETKADGAACSYVTSDDTGETGTCRAGKCR